MQSYVNDWTVLRFANRVIKAFVYLPVQPGAKDETNGRLFFAGKRQNWYIVWICPVSAAYNWATSCISIKVGIFRVTLMHTLIKLQYWTCNDVYFRSLPFSSFFCENLWSLDSRYPKLLTNVVLFYEVCFKHVTMILT